jgi:hypothetical protein
MTEPTFDQAVAHRYFAAHFFNRCWDFLDKTDRTPEDDERMIGLAHASICHWAERPDRTQRSRSIGYWQLARVYAMARRPEEARRYGELSLRHAAGEPAFYAAYAHEALARAAKLAGDLASYQDNLAKARELSAAVSDAAEREAVEKDLAELGG